MALTKETNVVYLEQYQRMRQARDRADLHSAMLDILALQHELDGTPLSVRRLLEGRLRSMGTAKKITTVYTECIRSGLVTLQENRLILSDAGLDHAYRTDQRRKQRSAIIRFLKKSGGAADIRDLYDHSAVAQHFMNDRRIDDVLNELLESGVIAWSHTAAFIQLTDKSPADW